VDISNQDKAGILIEALPYIQKWSGKTIVVKYGGNAMTDEAIKEAVIQDIILMRLVGIKVVVVHGGGPEINELLSRVGKEPVFIKGLRQTDADTMDLVQMVLAGKVNKSLVAHVMRNGGKALGLCGIDGGMLKARKKESDAGDLGFVGEIESVNPAPVLAALEEGYIPIIATVATGPRMESYNVNADTAAAALAGAIGAEKFILLTDVPGVLRDVKDPSSLIKQIQKKDLPGLMESGVISGGMIPKIECCAHAMDSGVHRAHIIDGRVPHSLLLEIFLDKGVGTMITTGELGA
jgi:acetylglutamate kinase